MPQVMIKRANENRVDDSVYMKLIESLPAIVSSALSAPPDGSLTEKEITVWDQDTPIPRYGVDQHDISIVIFAHNYPERIANIDLRRDEITDQCAALLPKGATLSVLIVCVPLSWGEITAA